MKFEHGLAEWTDPGSDQGVVSLPTTQCCHCGSVFPLPSFANDAESRKNRIGRGFCMNCNGFICGKDCEECVPEEMWLELQEGTRNPTAVKSAVPQGQIWTPGMP